MVCAMYGGLFVLGLAPNAFSPRPKPASKDPEDLIQLIQTR